MNLFCRRKHDYIPIGHFVFSFITASLASGLVYGWPSLRLQLISEEGSSLDEKTLAAIFTVGTWASQSSGFLFGIARDRWLGTRIAASIAILLTAMGTIGIAFSSNKSGISLIASMFFVGMGTGAHTILLPVACLFDLNVQGTILNILTGGFQISGLMFLILTSISHNRKIPFTCFGIILTVLGSIAAMILPRHQFNTVDNSDVEITPDAFQNKEFKEQNEDKNAKVSFLTHQYKPAGTINIGIQDNPEAETVDEGIQIEKTKEHNDDENSKLPLFAHQLKSAETVYDCIEEDLQVGTVNGAVQIEKLEELNDDENARLPSLVDQLKSAEYICLVLWLSIILIPLQVYIATIGYQLEQKGDESGKFTRLFSIVYASSAVASPLLGKIADFAGLGIAQAVATILTALSFFILSSNSIPLNVHAIGMMTYCFGRLMVFGTFFTNIGKRFGYSNYGTLAGLGLLISGIISLLQYPLINAATDGNNLIVNIVCGLIATSMLPYCIWLGLRERREYNSTT